ncbi:MAG: MFS transporter [Planctomyces sp.]
MTTGIDTEKQCIMTEALPPQVSIRRVVLASFVGTAIEWYDFFLYGTAAALVFNKLFFPEFDSRAGTMMSYGTFAVGFFARPLGGVVFGHFGDRLGRKAMLVITLMMMGMATFLVGCLPTYETIGVAAPLILVLLRFIQGLGVGGEWGAAVLMVVEHAEKNRRGLYASCVQAGVGVGLLLSTGAFSLLSRMPEDDFLSWGWRIPFLFGIVLMGIGFLIRLQIVESPVFQQMKLTEPEVKVPLFEVLRNYPRNVLLAMGARLAENSSFYIFTVWVLSYVKEELSISPDIPLNGVLIACAVQLISIPMFGALSDRLGRRPVYLAGAFAMLLWAFPFFWLVDTKRPEWIWTAILVGTTAHAAMYGPQAAFFSELFGTRTRYTGASLGYQLASPLAGGLAPFIASSLLKWTAGNPWPVAVYLMIMTVLTIGSVIAAGETHRQEL